ncbi:MAG: DUF177 domain-containing protein [Bacteroidales bacterium]|nr:DUF177 domain-containing protein [Bacteroidales bacterium]
MLISYAECHKYLISQIVSKKLYLCKLIASVRMMFQTNTIVRFSGLKSGVYDFEFRLGKEFFERFENEDLQGGEVVFYVSLERKERLMLFKMSFNGRVLTQCDRCLGELEVPVSGEHLLTVQISEEPVESEDEDVVVLSEKENEIDLGQWMYEFIVIAVPMRHVHPDDANGKSTCDPEMLKLLQTVHEDMGAEADQPVDPRWAKLLDLTD